MKSLKILLVLYIIITLMTLLIATNSNIIIEQRVWILTATYFIGMIAGLLAGYIGLSELIDKEETSNDKRTKARKINRRN